MALPREQRKAYLAADGDRCPFCQSWDYEGGSITVEAGHCVQKCHCHECGKAWTDVYKLIDVEELE